jgi:hypothetical protein
VGCSVHFAAEALRALSKRRDIFDPPRRGDAKRIEKGVIAPHVSQCFFFFKVV